MAVQPGRKRSVESVFHRFSFALTKPPGPWHSAGFLLRPPVRPSVASKTPWLLNGTIDALPIRSPDSVDEGFGTPYFFWL
jgi:hypothetical protein